MSTPTSQTTLCVVDMQPRFETSLHCLDGVLQEIRLAKKRKAAVVVLEYAAEDKSYAEIRKLLSNYPYAVTFRKHNDGGGASLLRKLRERNWPSKKLRFVGVNRSYCVLDTIQDVKDLTKKSPPYIEVVKKATWCEEPTRGLRDLKREGVKLI